MTRTILSNLAAAMLLSLALQAPAAAGHPQYIYDLIFQHAPTSANDSVIQVELDAEGQWTQIKNPRWRFAVGASWAQPPSEYEWILINVKHESTVWHIDNVFQINLLKNHGVASVGEPAQHHTFAVPYKYAVSIPGDGLYTQPDEMCHARRAQALDGGASLNKVLSEGFMIDLGATVKGELSVKYKGGTDMHVAKKHIDLPVSVRCVGNPELADALDPPPWQPGDIASPFEVTEASLVSFLGDGAQPLGPGKVETACPAALKLQGTLSAAGVGPGEVTYRFRWAQGAVSTVFSTMIADTSQPVYVSHSVPIPLPSAGAPGSQGEGGGGGAGSGGFVPVQPPPPPPQGPQSEAIPEPSQGPVILDPAEPAGNVHKDSVWIEVLSPNAGLKSNYAAYHIVCEPRVTKGIGAPGGMAVPAPAPLPGSEGAVRGFAQRSPGIPATPKPESRGLAQHELTHTAQPRRPPSGAGMPDGTSNTLLLSETRPAPVPGGPQLKADCQPAGHTFPQVIWDSGFADVASANAQIQTLQTLHQPTHSATQEPMKRCCSNAARPSAFHQRCGGSGAAEYQNICNHPNVTIAVGYRWACEAPGRGAPVMQMRPPETTVPRR